MFAMAIVAAARARPIVRMKSPIALFLVREWMLDMRADSRFRRIGLRCPLRHRRAARFLAMDAADFAVPLQVLLIFGRAASGIAPDTRRRVVRIDQTIAQLSAIIRRGVGGNG